MKTSAIKNLLNEAKKTISDIDLFLSKQYAKFLTYQAMGMSRKFKNSMKINIVVLEPEVTAATDGKKMVVNYANEAILQTYGRESTRLEKHRALRGRVAHETAHIMFTNMKLHKEIENRYRKKKELYPLCEFEADVPNATELLDYVKGPHSGQLWMKFAEFDNILEDCYIDSRIVGGGYSMSKDRAWLLDKSTGSLFTLEEILSDQKDGKVSAYDVALVMMLNYAKFGVIKCNPMNEQHKVLKKLYAIVPDLADLLEAHDPLVRVALIQKLFCYYWEELKEYLDSLPEPENDNSSDGATQTNTGSQTAQAPTGTGGTGSPSTGTENNDPDEDEQEQLKAAISIVVGTRATVPSGQGEDEESGEDDENGNGSSTDDSGEDEGDDDGSSSGSEEGEDDGADDSGSSEDYTDEVTEAISGAFEKAQENSQSSSETAGTDGRDDESEKDEEAMQKALESVIEQMAKEKVEENVGSNGAESLELISKEMEAADNDGVGCHISRYKNVHNGLVTAYNTANEFVKPIAKNLSRLLEQKLKDKRSGGRTYGFYSGKELSMRAISSKQLGIFQKKVLPTDYPRLAVAYLGDESGSMGGIKEQVNRLTALAIYSFCDILDIPVGVYGHDFGSQVNFRVYADFKKDPQDKYRIMNMSSNSCNRDGFALRLAAKRLMAQPADMHLLIITSDGMPTAYEDSEEGESDIRAAVNEFTRQGGKIIAAAMDDDKEAIQRIYGDAFLDITDLSKMPQKLVGMLAKYVM